MKFDKTKYKYIDHFNENGSREIVALSSYAGRVVKGYAKCDPRDTFDKEAGETLAAARCNFKVAKKRLANAQKKHAEAVKAYSDAMAQVTKMEAYLQCACNEYDEAKNVLDEIEKDIY